MNYFRTVTVLSCRWIKLSEACASTTWPCSDNFQRAFSSKKLYEPKPAPKRPRNKSKRPDITVWIGMTFGDLSKATGLSTREINKCFDGTPFEGVYRGHANECIETGEHLTAITRDAGFSPRYVGRPKTIDSVFDQMRTEAEMDVCRRPPTLDSALLRPRPPVVTIMGHVDHGKTTLLDFLRKSQIVQSEFGGITQHIGAFSVKMLNTDQVITFLDTPGHAAFKSMRARGARATDLVILVVAADDGVMEQTLESIRLAREAKVPIIVAINKCDKSSVDIERVKHQLLSAHLIPEEFGGDTQVVKISALKGMGIQSLTDAILTQAELMDLKAEVAGLVEGVVIESRTVHGKGKTTTVLVQRGTLRKGRFLVSGDALCCVRAMFDEHGRQVAQASPSMPVEVTGWRDDLPSAGDDVLEVESEKKAKAVINFRKSKALDEKAEDDARAIESSRLKERELYSNIHLQNIEAELKNLRIKKKKKKLAVKSFSQELRKSHTDNDVPVFNVVIKGDVDGSIEAILEVYETYNSDKCQFNVIHAGVGPVTENDVELAETFNGIVYAFNVKAESNVEALLKQSNVELKHFNVIYRLVDDFKQQLSQRLPVVEETEILGEGVVLQHFRITSTSGGYSSRKVPVAGCRCTKGTLSRKGRIKFLRGGEVYFDGEVDSMKKGTEPVSGGFLNDELGIMMVDPPEGLKFKPDDQVICYALKKVQQQIDWQPPGF